MPPIRKTIWAFMAVALLSGCQLEQQRPGPEPLAAEPTAGGDPAIQLRSDWEPAKALYVNDVVVAGPTYAPLRPAPGAQCIHVVTEPALFVANDFSVLAGLVFEPLWTEVDYKSLAMPPTYTAMPPLPSN